MKKHRSIIITGDDFGASPAVNAAILEAHRNGILTTASLMVTGAAFAEAVELARRHPRLAVGLHLTLTEERPASPPDQVPDLVGGGEGRFPLTPEAAGKRYFFWSCLPWASSTAYRQIQKEIRAQLEKFQKTGLKLSHVDGHQHMHMFPVVINALTELAREFNVQAVRIPSEELGLALKVDRSRFLEKVKFSTVFGMFRPHARKRLKSAGIRCPDRVYGLLQSGRVTEPYLLKLIPRIRADRVEVYSHPTTEGTAASPRGASRPQLEALTSARVREALDAQGFRLSTYPEMNGCMRCS